MVVDDETSVLATLERLVTSMGHTVVPYGTFEDARTEIEHGPVDALIVDIRLGAYNGLQLIHLARQRYPALSVLVVSGYDDPVLKKEAQLAGATFLLKPLTAAQLREHLTPTGEEAS